MSNVWYLLRQCGFDPVVFRASSPTQGDKQRFILEIFNIMNMANEPGMLALSTVYEAPAGAVNLHHTFFGQLATFIEVSYIGVIDGNTIDMTFTKPDNYVPPPFVGAFVTGAPMDDMVPEDDPDNVPH